jgi:hypothetical protein
MRFVIGEGIGPGLKTSNAPLDRGRRVRPIDSTVCLPQYRGKRGILMTLRPWRYYVELSERLTEEIRADAREPLH